MLASPLTPLAERNDPARTRERLLLKFRSDADLLSLGIAIARVVELASSEDEAAQNLTYYVLSDVALTQKILRLANTVFYRNSCSTPVTTVSRAIFMLGFDTIKSCALALLLVDNLSNRRHAAFIRKELVHSLCASLIGRELARQSHMQGAEEASIAALFRNLGRLLIASHEPELFREIMDLCDLGTSQAQAAIQVMGCSFDFLAENVLREWNIPEPLIHALEPLPSGSLAVAKSRQEWMRQVVSLSAEAAQVVLAGQQSISHAQIQTLLQRYGVALHLDMDKMRALLSLIGREIGQVIKLLSLSQPSNIEPQITSAPEIVQPSLPNVLKMADMAAHEIHTDERYPSGKPLNARDLLLAGIQVATQMMGTGKYKPSELLTLVVETLYSSLGFRFATVCIKDKRSNMYRAVMAMGEQQAARQNRFLFSTTPSNDMFHLAMENNADLVIADASTVKIRELLPDWHKALLADARSLMILPIVIDKSQVGLFYADRREPAPEGVTSDEAALIKTLMGQMVTAIQVR
ncbi:MAG: HDOD domain-containing protein [Burkholderiales bacterium]|nr:HDOD domain-containing protein [Burkholderiales bacterium]